MKNKKKLSQFVAKSSKAAKQIISSKQLQKIKGGTIINPDEDII